MLEGLKDAMQYLVDLSSAAPNKVTHETEAGTLEYTDRAVIPLRPELQTPVKVMTLTGLVGLIEGEGIELPADEVTLHVLSPTLVELIGTGCDVWNRRTEFGRADCRDISNLFKFDIFQSPEQLIIGLQSCFEETEDLHYLLMLASNISSEASATVADDGVSQNVTLKSGVHLKSAATLRSKVKLAPYRTFREIPQPVSDFLLRVTARGENQQQPGIGLFEAGGGQWKLAAMLAIKEYLAELVKAPIVA